jgi:hypothetical protein
MVQRKPRFDEPEVSKSTTKRCLCYIVSNNIELFEKRQLTEDLVLVPVTIHMMKFNDEWEAGNDTSDGKNNI